MLGGHRSSCGNEQLHRRQALLPIDDGTGCDVTCTRLSLLQDDGTQEVRNGVVPGRIVQLPFGDVANVLPERLPLQLARPDIGPLIERHDVLDVLPEDGYEIARIGLHE